MFLYFFYVFSLVAFAISIFVSVVVDTVLLVLWIQLLFCIVFVNPSSFQNESSSC